MFQYNSVAPGRTALRFACDERPACEASDVAARGGRVVYGVFIPSQNLRAVPPEGCFALPCFLLVTFLCTSKEKLPARPAAERKLWLSKVTRSPDASGKSQDAPQETNKIPPVPPSPASGRQTEFRH